MRAKHGRVSEWGRDHVEISGVFGREDARRLAEALARWADGEPLDQAQREDKRCVELLSQL